MSSSALMNQYASLKKQSVDSLLFFRLGDFYELFSEDAVLASRLLGLTLTQRNSVPMCGVPHHASDGYIAKLVEFGYKVAIAEQVHKPEKGLVERSIVEIVTPGTAINRGVSFLKDDFNYVLSFYLYNQMLVVALLDVGRGDFVLVVQEVSNTEEQVIEQIYKKNISELVVPKDLWHKLSTLKEYCKTNNIVINVLDEWHFVNDNSLQVLKEQFRVANLDGFALEGYSHYLAVASILLTYVKDQLQQELSHVNTLRLELPEQYLWIDDSSFRNLEILSNTQDGSTSHTLFSVLNVTTTVLGRRKLKDFLTHPLQDLGEINKRLSRVEEFVRNPNLVVSLRQHLQEVYDLERLTTRVMLSKAHAKDVLAIGKSLFKVSEIFNLSDSILIFDKEMVDACVVLSKKIIFTLDDNPSVDWQEGNIIRAGFNQKLDKLRNLSNNSRNQLEIYAQEERQNSGLPLRLKENRMVGWFFELNKNYADKVDERFTLRQSVVNGNRYVTHELKALEEEIAKASEESVKLEYELFIQLRQEVATHFLLLREVSQILATTDVFSSLAHVAIQYQYVKPIVTDQEESLEIRDGRHPIVERYSERSFIANHLEFSPEEKFLLITGPNMAGKSTYLRTNALIFYMAHVGSFVPARYAKIPLGDRLFCRVGASDNLSRGASTFLVEMTETARILHYATHRSFVIVDEVGRGTGSDDGLAIARAVMEHLILKVKSFTLFATHYHELTSLCCGGFRNYSLKVLEQSGSIFFTNEVISGPASGSYGIHVAKMAGIPQGILYIAQGYLEQLLEGDIQGLKKSHLLLEQSENIFSKYESLKNKLLQFDINIKTPLQALNFITMLQQEVFLGEKE